MTWKQLWHDWMLIAGAAAMCVGAFFLYRGAWNIGYSANAISLLGWHFLRFILLIIAWAFVVSGFRAALAKEQILSKSGITVAESIGAISIVLGCMGCYPSWPAVLLLMMPTYLVLIFHKTDPNQKRLSRSALLRAGVVVVLFVLTWYFCASTTRQALRGFGDRIESKAGADKLVAWAVEVIAADKQRRDALPASYAAAVGLAASPFGQGGLAATLALGAAAEMNRSPWLDPALIPPWVDDLLGPQQGVRGVMVEDYGYGKCVALFTGGSAFHFRIRVCPNDVNAHTPLWWFGESSGLESYGIYVETEGK